MMFLIGSYSNALSGEWDGRVIEALSGVPITIEQLATQLTASQNIVLGEKHNTKAVQEAQAKIIEAVVRHGQLEGHFVTAWEFLNYSSQSKTASEFWRFVSGEIDPIQLLINLHGSNYNSSYTKILEATRDFGGMLLGVNLSREEKAPVVREGLKAADPTLIPQGFEMGGSGYFERFAEAMQGHTPPEKIQNYFEAQCLTDDVMAFHIAESGIEHRFLVAGSFHSDYSDGVVARLKTRDPYNKTAVVKFLDASDFSEDDLRYIAKHPKYGLLADYIYFVNEPD